MIRITRKEILLLVVQLIPMVALLFLYADLVGCLFVGDDYEVRAWFRFKVFAFVTAFTVAYLIGTNILKWPLRRLAYVGYPLYMLMMALCGVLTVPHDLMGYKLALCLMPFSVAYASAAEQEVKDSTCSISEDAFTASTNASSI